MEFCYFWTELLQVLNAKLILTVCLPKVNFRGATVVAKSVERLHKFVFEVFRSGSGAEPEQGRGPRLGERYLCELACCQPTCGSVGAVIPRGTRDDVLGWEKN